MWKLVAALCSVLMLAGCAGESVWAPDEMIKRVTYRHDGPPKLTLFTMINNNNNSGAHTSLMVNASQRVIFDPAGSFKHPSVAERNDVIFGANPHLVESYTRYHARETFRVRVQSVPVSAEVAEGIMLAMKEYGAVPPAQCALSTSTILARFFPGQISRGWYPNRLAEQFAQLPGATDRVLREYDSDDNSKVLEDWDPNRAAQEAMAQAGTT